MKVHGLQTETGSYVTAGHSPRAEQETRTRGAACPLLPGAIAMETPPTRPCGERVPSRAPEKATGTVTASRPRAPSTQDARPLAPAPATSQPQKMPQTPGPGEKAAAGRSPGPRPATGQDSGQMRHRQTKATAGTGSTRHSLYSTSATACQYRLRSLFPVTVKTLHLN